MKKSVLIIGLDPFGISVAEELTKLDCDVVALDIKEEAVSKVVNVVSEAIIGDSTDPQVLQEIGAAHVDHVIVSIPGNVQNSILTTMILSEMKVPKITVKIDNPYHAKVAERVGATEIIDSERSAGIRVARRLISDNVLDYYNITEDYGVYEIKVSETFKETKLIDLDVRNRFDVNILLITRDKKTISPRADTIIYPNDVIIIISKHDKVHKFEMSLK